jgi:hypothetical protein
LNLLLEKIKLDATLLFSKNKGYKKQASDKEARKKKLL